MKLVLPLALSISFQSTLSASVYYVDRNHASANDANSGSIDSHWLTIQHAVNQATQPGDIIYVRAGTYDERVVLSSSGDSVGGHINLVGYPDDPTPVMHGYCIQYDLGRS